MGGKLLHANLSDVGSFLSFIRPEINAWCKLYVPKFLLFSIKHNKNAGEDKIDVIYENVLTNLSLTLSVFDIYLSDSFECSLTEGCGRSTE